MKLFVLLPCLLYVLIHHVGAQCKITPAAMKKIFPYAGPVKVEKFTTKLNKMKTVEKRIENIDSWSKENEFKTPVKVDSAKPYTKKGFSGDVAKKFMKHREAVTLLLALAAETLKKSSILTAKECDEMKANFCKFDKKYKNEHLLAMKDFMESFPDKKAKQVQKTFDDVLVKIKAMKNSTAADLAYVFPKN